ncbi:hypothetical protein AB0D58_30290 [Streptomyces sp. NPDC048210]|uniref:hypothetical protein n=1 Tax=Streptomyces sp. NPDC048210 TaxID=3156657 RepID=UPI0034357747
MGEARESAGGKTGEVARQGVGRQYKAMSADATEEAKEFALCVRDLFARLKKQGMGQREIGEELGEGLKAATLQRMGQAAMLPTPEQLRKLLLLVEVKIDAPLPTEVHQRIHAAHVAALRKKNPKLYELIMAEEQARFWQQQCEELEARGALTERELDQSRSIQVKLAAQLEQSRAEIEKVRSDARSAAQVSEAEHAAALNSARGRLSELSAVKSELEGNAELLRARIERLEIALREAHEEQADALEALGLANERADEAELAALIDQRELEKLGEDVSLLQALLEQVRTERDDLQREHASRAADADVLAAAEAAVRRAEQRLNSKEPAHAGAAPGDESMAPHGLEPSRNEMAHEAVRLGGTGSAAEIVVMLQGLLEAGDLEAVQPLLAAVAGRGGEDVLAVMGALGEAGCYRQREQLLRACARLPAAGVVAIVHALQAGDATSEVGWLLDESAQAPAQDLTGLVSVLLEREMKTVAARLLDAAVPRRPPSEVAELIHVLERGEWIGEAQRLAQDSVVRRPGRDVVALLPRLPEASLAAALSALAQRPLKALVPVLALLSASGEAALTAAVTDRVATRPVADVAEVLALLQGPESAGDWGWLLDSFLQQRPGNVVELANALAGPGRDPVRRELVDRIGARGDAEQIERIAGYLGQRGLEETALLQALVRRQPEAVWSLVVTFAGSVPNLAAAALTQSIRDLPLPAAVEVVDRLLESGLTSLNAPLTHLVATACRDLEHAVQLAQAMRAGLWNEEASAVLETAGRTVLSPADFATAVGGGLAVQDLLPILRGACEREAEECVEMVQALHEAGAAGYAQLMVEYLPQSPSAFVGLSDGFAEAGLEDYAFALHQRAVRTAPLASLADIFVSCSVPTAISLSEATVERDPALTADLIVELADWGSGYSILALLRAAGSGSAERCHSLAELLAVANRPRQSRWLTEQARLMRGRRDTSHPPPETFDEAADAAKQLFEYGLPNDCFIVLDHAIVDLDISAAELISALDPDVLSSYCRHLAYRGGDGPAAQKVLPVTAEGLVAYLNELPEGNRARSALMQHAARHVPPVHSADLFATMNERATGEELADAHHAVSWRGDPEHVVQIARAIAAYDTDGAHQILRNALHRHVNLSDAGLLLKGAARIGIITNHDEAAAFMAHALPNPMIAALLTAHYPPTPPPPVRQPAADEKAWVAVASSFQPAPPQEEDLPAGYRRQRPSDSHLTYWNGRAWTGYQLPVEPEAAKPLLSLQLEEARQASAPFVKARLYQQLAAGYAALANDDLGYTAQAHNAQENHAYWIGRAGDWKQAAQIQDELVQAHLRHLGPGAPATLRCRYNHANSIGMAGNHSEAANLFERLLTDYKRLNGLSGKDTILTLRAYAIWTGIAGNPAKAVRLLEQAINRLLHGHRPDDTAELKNILEVRALHAQWTGKAGNSRQAAWLYEQLTTYSNHLLGPAHDLTIRTRIGHASWAGEAGDARHAANLYRRIVEDCAKHKGSQHDTTLQTRKSYAHWLENAGDHTLAARVREKIAVDTKKDAAPPSAPSTSSPPYDQAEHGDQQPPP